MSYKWDTECGQRTVVVRKEATDCATPSLRFISVQRTKSPDPSSDMSFSSEHQSSITSASDYYTFFESIASSSQVVPFSSSGSDTCSLYGETIRSHHPYKRMEANARERDRTCHLNSAYKRLRDMIPTEPQNRKLSKIEILRLAKSYIEHLDNVRAARMNGDFAPNPCSRMNACRRVCTFCLTSSKRLN